MLNKIILIFIIPLLLSCGQQREPLNELMANLSNAPDYSIILNDMKEEGVLSSTYYHKYKVTQGEEAYITDWLEVSKDTYLTNQNFLGMTLVSAVEGEASTTTPHPPGYQYIGNSQYGQWRNDSRGNSFWEFYGQYAFFTHMFGWGSRPFYRSDYDTYRSYRTGNRPYYGSNNQYGTGGAHTKRTNPGFFERKMSRQKASKTRFSEKVNRRFGGGRSSFGSGRGGFGGFGK